MTRKKIGIFDSGVGGLFVLQKLNLFFSQIDWIYFSDTAHWPYGNKSKEQLLSYSLNILNFLNSQSVDGILAACNTASSLFMKTSSYKNKIPFINIIEPSLKKAYDLIEKENKKRIGVLATQWTVQSEIFKQSILNSDPHVEVFQYYIPELIELIEKNNYENPHFKLILKNFIQKIQKQKLEALILGCTHYLTLKEILEPYVLIVDPIENLVQTFKDIFKIEEIKEPTPVSITFYSSQKSHSFEEQAEKIIGTCKVHLIS